LGKEPNSGKNSQEEEGRDFLEQRVRSATKTRKGENEIRRGEKTTEGGKRRGPAEVPDEKKRNLRKKYAKTRKPRFSTSGEKDRLKKGVTRELLKGLPRGKGKGTGRKSGRKKGQFAQRRKKRQKKPRGRGKALSGSLGVERETTHIRESGKRSRQKKEETAEIALGNF